MQTLAILFIPFLGTALGAGMVFFMRKKMNSKVEKTLLGFASGVMIAASVWSLLIPSIELAETESSVPWLPAAAGFFSWYSLFTGIGQHHSASALPRRKAGGNPQPAFREPVMLIFAVTLHNLPEGMAVRRYLRGRAAPGIPVSPLPERLH